MRIVAGRFKGTSLATPKDTSVRPTTDRTREALFNILAHGFGGCEDARVLDLFAGTGALGLEALSRGAAACLFVEENATARGLIRANIEKTKTMGITKVFRRDATRLGDAGTIQPFSLVFLDPPYGKGLGAKAIEAALNGGWLQQGALIVHEERAEIELEAPPHPIEHLETRQFGDTQIQFLHLPEDAPN